MRTNKVKQNLYIMATYKRILLKLSGESLMGEKQYGIDEKRLAEYAAQIKEIHGL